MREVRNERGLTQLNYFCRKGMTSSVVRMLEMRSIDVEGKQGVNGLTCLHAASENGHLAICRLLLDKGAQVEAKDRSGWTPLHYAAYKGHVEIVRLLCDHGAEIEACINTGWRPLHLAAIDGHIAIMKELIEERNVEINARMNDEYTSLRVARARNKADVAAYLVSHGGIE